MPFRIAPALAAGFSAAAFAAASPSRAADEPAAGASGPVTRYEAAAFASAQLASAYDMVQRLPGFRLQEGDAALRGYAGAAGNVLIDGHPLTSKEETLEALLKRVPAASVDHIDLIRSAAAGVDMQGHELLANVVRRAAARAGGRLEAGSADYRHGLSAPRVAGDLNLRRGATTLDLQGALYRDIDDEHGFGVRNRYAANGAPRRLADYAQPEGADVREASFAYGGPFADGGLRITGLVKDRRMFANITSEVTLPAPATSQGSEREHSTATEGAVRYEHDLGHGTRLELLASRRDTRTRARETSTDADGSEATRAVSDAAETILRGVVRRKGPISLELGAEAARNTLDSHTALFADGVAIPLPAADVRIEEARAELFASATWRAASSLTAEAGLRFETSRLTQTGDSRLERSLSALKPRLLLSYAATPRDQVRLLIEREVGQLDFDNFVSDASLTSGVVTAGNRDLQPESLWRAEATWDRRIGAGALVLTARREWVSHLVDRIGVTTPQGVFDAVGNIGRGSRGELEADVNMPLDELGLPGLTLRGVALARRTRATDPLTGERRRISGEAPFEASVSMTQDLPAHRLRFGASLVLATTETKFKLDEVERDRLSDRLDAFVEFKPDPRWTLRLYGRNLTDSAAVRTRELYDGPRSGAPVDGREVRILRSGPYFGVTAQRTFGG